MSVFGAPISRVFVTKVELDGDVEKYANDQTSIDAFLASFSIVPGDYMRKPPLLVCNASLGDAEQSWFVPDKVMQQGSHGKVWKYNHVCGPEPVCEVCLKVIEPGRAYQEAQVIEYINSVNKSAGVNGDGCKIINARVLRLSVNNKSFVLMRRAANDLVALDNRLEVKDALKVVEAMAIEVENTYSRYGLRNLDIKPDNFLYTVTDEDTVEVYVADLGSLIKPGGYVTTTTFKFGEAYGQECLLGWLTMDEDFEVFQLAKSLCCLIRGGITETEIETVNVTAFENTALAVALAYGLQTELDGSLVKNAGKTGVTVRRFIDALNITGNDKAVELDNLRKPLYSNVGNHVIQKQALLANIKQIEEMDSTLAVNTIQVPEDLEIYTVDVNGPSRNKRKGSLIHL